jgi:hypothetical protein
MFYLHVQEFLTQCQEGLENTHRHYFFETYQLRTKCLYQYDVRFISSIVTSKKPNCNKVSWLIFAFYEGWIFAKLVFPA